MRSVRRAAQIVSLVLLIILASACSGASESEALLSDYLTRLSRITDEKIPESGETNESQIPLRYPSRSIRRWKIEQRTLKVSDYWGLRHCTPLFALINERNSILGRVQLPLERLLYEHSFIVTAEQCLASTDESDHPLDQALQEKLTVVVNRKKDLLGKLLWNASFDSDAFATSFSLATEPLGRNAAATTSEAMANIESWLALADHIAQQPATKIDSEIIARLIESREQMTNGRFGGSLLLAIQKTTEALNQGTAMLQGRLQKKPLCPLGKPNQKATIFRNVFGNIYSARLQPYLSQLHRDGGQWLRAVNRLYAHPAVQRNPSFLSYQQSALSLEHTNSLWGSYQLAIKQHVKAWQQQLRQCGLMPK